jgi:penicillin-binding protein 2
MGQKKLKIKLLVFMGIVSVIFTMLLGRLAYVQLAQSQQYKLQSDQNRIRMISIPPRRGDIITRDGQVLATSYASYSIVTANLGRNMDHVYQHLVALLDDYGLELTVDEIKEALTAQGFRRHESVPILQNVPFELVALIKERQEELPGIDIEVVPRRFYPNETIAGHMLGYVTQINRSQLDQFRQYDYRMGDPFGQIGLERVYEFLEEKDKEIGLRGQKGVRQVEVNVANRPIRELLTIPAVPGNSLVLTIDFNLQRAMEEALETVIKARAEVENPKANGGAAVAIDPRTGAILAIASYPRMDPNDFIKGFSQDSEIYEYYEDNLLKARSNRVFQEVYAPGSTFKMITGMAALEKGISPEATVFCGGFYPGGIKCWDVHGSVDYYRAVQVSCNTYFQSVAIRTGADKIAEVALDFGLGQRTGINLRGEVTGNVPSPVWKKELNEAIINRRYEARYEALDKEYEELLKEAATEQERNKLQRDKGQRRRAIESQYRIDYNFHTRWQDFDTYNTSIGQGSNDYTILQLANYAAAVGNGGYLYEPYLVDSIVDPNGQVVKKYESTLIREVRVSKETIEHTKKGMLMVTQPGGTAWRRFAHFPKEIQVAGKTGTAQASRPGADSKVDFDGFFVGFAPYDEPKIAIAVVVEFGGGGGASAGVVTQMVLEEYFGLNKDE